MHISYYLTAYLLRISTRKSLTASKGGRRSPVFTGREEFVPTEIADSDSGHVAALGAAARLREDG